MTVDPREVALRRVQAAAELGGQVDDDEATAVRDARASGVTVQKIADALGKVQPDVSKKYGPLPAGDPDPSGARSALGRLRAIPARRERAFKALVAAVAEARNTAPPVSWQAIADATGISTRGNASVKFLPLLEVTESGQVRPAGRTGRKPRAHLTAEQRAELTRRVRAGESPQGLADEFGVHPSYPRWLKAYG